MPAPNRTEPLPETVLLVHGTWANAASAAPAWWQADSDFSSRMNQALEKNGSPARCWADVRFRLTDRPPVFAWTGANRESDRLAAGLPWRTRCAGTPSHGNSPAPSGRRSMLGSLLARRTNGNKTYLPICQIRDWPQPVLPGAGDHREDSRPHYGRQPSRSRQQRVILAMDQSATLVLGGHCKHLKVIL
jgi:hypothetical protein